MFKIIGTKILVLEEYLSSNTNFMDKLPIVFRAIKTCGGFS